MPPPLPGTPQQRHAPQRSATLRQKPQCLRRNMKPLQHLRAPVRPCSPPLPSRPSQRCIQLRRPRLPLRSSQCPHTRRRQHRYARLRINILRHTPLHRCTHQHLRISSLRLLPQRQSSRRSNRPRQFQPEFCPRRLGPPRPSRPRPHIGNPSRSWRRSLHQRPRATAPGSHSPRTLRKPSRTA